MSKNDQSSLGVHRVVLLPCPFCGGDEPYISETDDGLARWICCPSCDAEGPPIDYRFSGTKDEARKIVVDAWNTRIVAGHKVCFHLEQYGVIAPTSVWVVLHNGYMYGPHERWQDVEKIVREEWQHDRHLVG